MDIFIKFKSIFFRFLSFFSFFIETPQGSESLRGTGTCDRDEDGDEGQNPKQGRRVGGISPPLWVPIAIPSQMSVSVSVLTRY